MIFLLPLRPPHLPLTSPCASPSLPPPPHLHLPSHLCPPVRPAKSRRPWGRSGVGQRRWGAPGSLFPSDRLQSRVRRGPARGGIGSPGSALCCAAGTPPPHQAPPSAATGGPGWRKKGAVCQGLGSSGSEENPLQRPAQCPQLGKSGKAQHRECWRAHSGSPPARARTPLSPGNNRREVPL